MPQNKDGLEAGGDVSFADILALRAAKSVVVAEPVAGITRESIADMKKADLVPLLEAHGAETGGKIDDLRDRLVSVMFVDL